jgi:hypothetical protein
MNRLLFCFIVAGCAGGKSNPNDDLSGLTDDIKADTSNRVKLVGNLTVGQTSAPIKYSKSPKYRGLTLPAKGPALLDIWVRSSDGGDAVAWLMDASGNVLASNDDADATTYDSHVTFTLPAGGQTYYIVFRDYNYARHTFTVEVLPAKPAPGDCQVGLLDPPDDPPGELACMEELLGDHLGSYQLYDRYEPDCLDWSSASVRAAVAQDILANNGIDWQDAGQPVASAIKVGATDFLAALETAHDELQGYANSALGKPANFTSCYPGLERDMSWIIGDAQTNPGAYLEFDLHLEAEECSQDGFVRIDTRSGAVLILRQHGC